MSKPKAPSLKKWRQVESETLIQTPFLRMRSDRCELPDGRVMPKYFVIEFADWVSVVPVTPDRELILVRQYRHAAGDSFLELPGGTTDTRSPEAPEEAAKRELLEETGYTPKRLVYLGHHFPNPALQTNKMHCYLALDCRKTADLNLDPFEDIDVELHPLDALPQLMRTEIVHSLMLATLTRALPEIHRLLGGSDV